MLKLNEKIKFQWSCFTSNSIAFDSCFKFFNHRRSVCSIWTQRSVGTFHFFTLPLPPKMTGIWTLKFCWHPLKKYEIQRFRSLLAPLKNFPKGAICLACSKKKIISLQYLNSRKQYHLLLKKTEAIPCK